MDAWAAFRQHFPDSLIILSIFLAGWTAFGLLFGRGIAGWFPFLRTCQFYLPIKSRRLARLLISRETSYWGKTQPKYLHVKYYQIPPHNRNKMNLWGILFYSGWIALPFLVFFGSQLPSVVSDLAYCLILLWPLLIRLLAGLDYNQGFQQALQEEQKRDREQETQS